MKDVIHPDCTIECEAAPHCVVCGLRKKPIGRDAPAAMANSLCDHECAGYRQDPKPGHLWPGELARLRAGGAAAGVAVLLVSGVEAFESPLAASSADWKPIGQSARIAELERRVAELETKVALLAQKVRAGDLGFILEAFPPSELAGPKE